MSFRYVIHLKTGQRIRSGVISDDIYELTFDRLWAFMKYPEGCGRFLPECKDSDVFNVIVARENVSHITFLTAK